MKTRLIIAILAATVLFCSCKERCAGCYDCDSILVITKPADLKPIDWDGWNDAYTVWHTFHDVRENAQYSHRGDTIMCYGKISRILTSHIYSSLIYLECKDASEPFYIYTTPLMDSIEKDSLVNLLDGICCSDTCFARGVLDLSADQFTGCSVEPSIELMSIEDIYFKKSQP